MKTRNELHTVFKVEMDKNGLATAFGGAPGFLPEEIDYWINKAVIQVVNNKFTGNNVLRIPFENSVKRVNDLLKLVKTDNSLLAIKLGKNSCVISDLFNNRMYFVSAFLHFDDNITDITLVDHDKADPYIYKYNNNPFLDSAVAVIEDNKMIVYYDAHTMEPSDGNFTIDLTYIKYPTKIEDYPVEGSDELPDYMWFEIIDKAVLLALEDIESLRVQTKSQLNQVNE